MLSITTEQSQIAENLTIIRRTETQPKKKRIKEVRVAAYCRVSKNIEEQKTSIKIQMESYDRIIREHPGWKIAGIYTDPGKTGTNMSGRPQFRQMLEDAKAGKIDMILVKSTSRFARNTVDLLNTVRMLSSHGVGVFFEKEKINTLSLQSEMLLTVYAAFAQEESRSISENMKHGIRQRFELGIPKWALTYGLESDGNDNWTINEDEAKIVRLIFEMTLDGKGATSISDYLNKAGIPSPNHAGKRCIWYQRTVQCLLDNEKYCGDARMQKYYTTDRIVDGEFRFHDCVKNKKIEQYYVRDHHPAIVPRDVFEDADYVSTLRNVHRGASQYPYYGRLLCPHCGKPMVRVPVCSGKSTNAWVCGGEGKKLHYSERTSCPLYLVKEPYLSTAVRKVFLGMKLDGLKAEEAELLAQAQKRLQGRETVEFLDLRKLVKSITFPDWDTVEVTWVWGEKSKGEFKVTRPSDYPDPIIRKVKGKSMIGPIELTSRTVTQVAASLEGIAERIEEIEIFENPDAEENEPPFVGMDARKNYRRVFAEQAGADPKPKQKRPSKLELEEYGENTVES